MSDEQKTLEVSKVKKDEVKKPKNEKGKKSSKGKSIGWFIGVAVLILISLSFVLPQTMFYDTSSSTNSFGKYNNRSIDLTYDSYFYYMLQNYYSYYTQLYGADVAQSYGYNIYYTAYQSALVHEALAEKAEKAGIQVSDQAIAEQVISSGFYSDGENSYSSEVYKSTDDSQRKVYNKWVREYLTEKAVTDDFGSAKTSKGEDNFISDLSADTKSFEYIVLTGDMYPEADTVSYLEGHKDLFQSVSFKRATYATEEEAASALSAIATGAKTIDEAISESVGTDGTDYGTFETVYRFTLDNYLKSTAPETSAEIFASASSSLVGPVSTQSGYSIYFMESAAKDADPSSADVISVVKGYISQYDSDVMKAYLEAKAAEVALEAKDDFTAAAEKYDLDVYTVSGAAENPGESQFIAGLNYLDANGYLSSAVSADASLSSTLFSAPEGTVSDALPSGSSYVIARSVENNGTSSYYASILASMYPSSAVSVSYSDFQNIVLNSDKTEDNFFPAYLNMLTASMGTN